MNTQHPSPRYWLTVTCCLWLGACGDEQGRPAVLQSDAAAAADAPDATASVDVPREDGALACTTGQTPCGTYCADTARDPLNCGGCGMPCAAGSGCTAGQCQTPMTGDGGMVGPDGSLTCGAGLVTCGAYCADTARDPLNPGGGAVGWVGSQHTWYAVVRLHVSAPSDRQRTRRRHPGRACA